MANVTFHVGTTTPGSSGLTADGLYVDKTNGQIFYATSTTAKKQIGSSLKMMNDKGWTLLNGTTGYALNSSSLTTTTRNTIVNYARDIHILIKNIPENVIYPASKSTKTHTISLVLTRSWNDSDKFTTIAPYVDTSSINGTSGDEVVFIRDLYITITDKTTSWTYGRIRQNASGTGNIIAIGNSRNENISSYVYIIGYRF